MGEPGSRDGAVTEGAWFNGVNGCTQNLQRVVSTAVGRSGEVRSAGQCSCCRVRPAGQAGDGVEGAQQPSHQLLGIVLRAQLLEPTEHRGQRVVGVGDGTLREVLALPRETFAVPMNS